MPLGTETARWQAPRVPSHRSGASGRPSSSGRGRAVASGRKQNGSATRHWDLRGPLFRECSCDGRSRRGAADPQLPTSRCVILAWPGLDITSSTALPRPLPLRSPSFAGASSGAEVRTVSLIGGGSGRARGGCGATARRRRSARRHRRTGRLATGSRRRVLGSATAICGWGSRSCPAMLKTIALTFVL